MSKNKESDTDIKDVELCIVLMIKDFSREDKLAALNVIKGMAIALDVEKAKNKESA